MGLKTYCYIKSKDGMVQPICLRHEDGTVVYYNTELGKIDFDGCKIGDTMKMFNADELEDTVKITGIKTVNGIKRIEYESITKESINSNFIVDLLSNTKAVLDEEIEVTKDKIEECEIYMNDLKANLASFLNQRKDVIDFANINKIKLKDIQVVEEEEE